MGIDASTVGFCMIGIFVASRSTCCSASMCPVSYCCAAEVRRVAVRMCVYALYGPFWPLRPCTAEQFWVQQRHRS